MLLTFLSPTSFPLLLQPDRFDSQS
jgi:hypothetical protein